ncbi:GTA-gp10 family protein [Paracoccaceae bacterium GXU_MW_L88]
MVNPHQGEVALVIDGAPRRMKLTLGALAALEAALEAESLEALVARFERGAFTARDLLRLIEAGLMGGGAEVDRAALEAAEIEGGTVEAARQCGRMLVLAFRGAT